MNIVGGFFIAFFVTLVAGGIYQAKKHEKDIAQYKSIKNDIKQAKAKEKTMKSVPHKSGFSHTDSSRPHDDFVMKSMMHNAMLHGLLDEDDKDKSRYEGNDKELFEDRTSGFNREQQNHYSKSLNNYDSDRDSHGFGRSSYGESSYGGSSYSSSDSYSSSSDYSSSSYDSGSSDSGGSFD